MTLGEKTYDLLRERIQSMAPGVPLPSVKDLMAEFSVSQSTLVSAYAELERCGLIERKSRKGVFVADRMATGEMAVVLSQSAMTADASPAFRMTCSVLRTVMHDFNPQCSFKVHMGVSTVSGDEFPFTLDLLNEAVLPRLRGVFSFYHLRELEKELENAGVPVVHLHHLGQYCVCFDRNDFLCQSVEHLKETGCRDISFLFTKPDYESSEFIERQAQIRMASETAIKGGMSCRNEMIVHGECGWTEQHGYDLFMRMWKDSEHVQRPDGIIVCDDVLCKGVLRAILHLGLKLPEDLQLITYSNQGCDLPYHKSVTRVEFDIEAKVQCAVEMMNTLMRGQKLSEPSAILAGKLIRGETTKKE